MNDRTAEALERIRPHLIERKTAHSGFPFAFNAIYSGAHEDIVALVEAAEAREAERWEFNVARLAASGELWDIFDDETLLTLEAAEYDREGWARELDDPNGDPVVIVRRPRGHALAAWERVSEAVS